MLEKEQGCTGGLFPLQYGTEALNCSAQSFNIAETEAAQVSQAATVNDKAGAGACVCATAGAQYELMAIIMRHWPRDLATHGLAF